MKFSECLVQQQIHQKEETFKGKFYMITIQQQIEELISSKLETDHKAEEEIFPLFDYVLTLLIHVVANKYISVSTSVTKQYPATLGI